MRTWTSSIDSRAEPQGYRLVNRVIRGGQGIAAREAKQSVQDVSGASSDEAAGGEPSTRSPSGAVNWVPLAEILRPHGVRGELRLRPYNRDSQLLLELDEVYVRFADGEGSEISVESARPANDAILMKLFSIDDRNRAEALRGAVVCAKRVDFPPVEEGEFYVCDVEGARVVVDGTSGDESDLGRVRELVSYPTVDVLIVDAADGGRPWEVPLVDSVVRSVDVASGCVRLVTSDGLERV